MSNMPNITLDEVLQTTQSLLRKAASVKSAAMGAAVPSGNEGEVGKTGPSTADQNPTPAREGEEKRNIGQKGPQKGKDDSKVTRGHAVDGTQSVASTTEKALIAGNADAPTDGKTTSATANLVNDVLGAMAKYQAMQMNKPAAVASPVKAAAEPMKITPDMVQKLASENQDILQGRMFAHQLMQNVLQKQAADAADYAKGQQDAQAVIQALGAQTQAAEQQKAAAAVDERVKQMAIQHVATTYPDIVKAAEANNPQAAQAALILAQDAYVKLGQAIADQSMADLQSAMGGAEGGAAPAADPMAAPAADPMAAPAGGEGGEIEMEPGDLEAAIQQLVAAGVIKPEDVQAVMAMLSQTGEDAGSDAGEPAEGPAEGGAPAPEKSEGGESKEKKEEKEASAKAARVNKIASVLAVNIGMAKAAAAASAKK